MTGRPLRDTATADAARPPSETLLGAIVSGTVTSLATTAALAALARLEGKPAVQPTNATSHWLHGEKAGRVEAADASHTLLGFATHYGSAIFWATLMEAWSARSRPQQLGRIASRAAAVTATAAAVDYLLVPRRLTPGWESVLSKRSIAATYGVMGASLVLGALLARGRKRRRSHSDALNTPS